MRPVLVLLALLLSPLLTSAALFSSPDSLQNAVHHWLHWGANSHPSSAAAPAHHPRASAAGTPPARLPAWVSGAAGANVSEHVPDFVYERQMMHRAEVDLVASYLRPSDVYLEYGSGGSTLNFVGRVRKAFSIEHDCEWADFLSASVRGREGYASLDLRCVEVPRGRRGWGTLSKFEHANYEQFKEYVDEVASLPEKLFDKVFIDGRARVACALKILPFLRDDSVVFIHDFYARTQLYSGLLPYYVEVGRVLAYRNSDASQGPIDEPQGLLVLRRKPSVRYPLSEEEIHAAYQGFDWREPFGPPLTSPLAYVRYYIGMATDFGRWKRARNPDSLVELVRHDLIRMAMLYAMAMFLVRNWAALLGRRARPSALSGKGGAGGERKDAEATAVVVGRGGEERRRNVGSDGGGQGIVGSRSVGREEVGRAAVDKRKAGSEPRFVETEGMKAAQARRKMRQSAMAKGRGCD